MGHDNLLNLLKNLLVVLIVGVLLVGLFKTYEYTTQKISTIKLKKTTTPPSKKIQENEDEAIAYSFSDESEKNGEETATTYGSFNESKKSEENFMVYSFSDESKTALNTTNNLTAPQGTGENKEIGRVVIKNSSAFLLDEFGKPIQRFRPIEGDSYYVYKITESGEELDGTAQLVSSKNIGGIKEEIYHVYDKDGNLKKQYMLRRK